MATIDKRDLEIQKAIVQAIGLLNELFRGAAQKDLVVDLELDEVKGISMRTHCHKLKVRIFKEL